MQWGRSYERLTPPVPPSPPLAADPGGCPMKVTTKSHLPSGCGTVKTYDENDQYMPKEFGYLPEDKSKAYGPLAKPQQTIFERKGFRWIRGVE